MARFAKITVLVCAGALACLGAESLNDVLTHMDAAAKSFTSYSATIKRLDYAHLFKTTDKIDGTIRLKRVKNGVIGNMDFTEGKDHYTIHLEGNTVEKYLPEANMVQVFNAKQFASTMDETLLLGFAVPRDELERDYKIQLAGTETVDGKACSHLMLTPKSAEALKLITTIELWVPDGQGNPIQQKGNEPSGDYRLATFSDLKLNPPLPDTAFQLKVPPGTQRVKAN